MDTRLDIKDGICDYAIAIRDKGRMSGKQLISKDYEKARDY